MSATATALTIPVEASPACRALPSPIIVVHRAARFLRARWIYHATLADLENYSEHLLEDMGVKGEIMHGVDDFSRRAAGL